MQAGGDWSAVSCTPVSLKGIGHCCYSRSRGVAPTTPSSRESGVKPITRVKTRYELIADKPASACADSGWPELPPYAQPAVERALVVNSGAQVSVC
jgi:hypothetical protein